MAEQNNRKIRNKNLPGSWHLLIGSISCLSCFGLVLSSYLAYTAINHIAVPCSLTKGCATVEASSHSHILGVPVAGLGVLFYLALLVLTIWLVVNPRVIINRIILILAGGGFLFSIYLSSLEEFVIHAWCAWCISSAILTVIIFVLSLLAVILHDKRLKVLT